METTCLSGRQMLLAQELLHYDYKIDYHLRTKNLANSFSHPLTNEDNKKELVEQNCKILEKLQHTLSEKNHLLLNTNSQAVIWSTVYDKNNYS